MVSSSNTALTGPGPGPGPGSGPEPPQVRSEPKQSAEKPVAAGKQTKTTTNNPV